MSTCSVLTRSNLGTDHHAHPDSRSRLLVLLTSSLVALLTILASSGVASAASRDDDSDERPCDPGVFCTWADTDYTGQLRQFDLRTTNMEECVTLTGDVQVRSFVNRLGRPVTVYQDTHCGTTGDFSTYPGGTYVPEAPFVVRAIQIWTH